MIGPGDDIVAKINDGLEQAGAGLIVFSAHSGESRWVEAEVSYLTYARIQESKVLIPIRVGEDAYVPPLLRPLAWRGIEEVDAIADALLHRRAGPSPVAALRPAGASGSLSRYDGTVLLACGSAWCWEARNTAVMPIPRCREPWSPRTMLS